MGDSEYHRPVQGEKPSVRRRMSEDLCSQMAIESETVPNPTLSEGDKGNYLFAYGVVRTFVGGNVDLAS